MSTITTPADVNRRFAMYSPEANAAVKAMCDRVVQAVEDGLSRKDLEDVIRAEMRVVFATYPEVYDTEPEWAITDEINERVCKPQMWVLVDRWDL